MFLVIWAASWQNQQTGMCAQQSLGPEFFAVCMKKAWVLSYPMSAQQRLWSDWADSHFVGFVMRWLIYFHNTFYDFSNQ